MKRNLLFIVSFLLTISNSFGQIVKTEKIFSDAIKDSIKIAVYLPENWTETKKYPVIYDFEMLSITDMNSKILADNISSYSEYLELIPQTLVVAIDLKSGNELGYSYNTGMINANGEKFLTAVQENIFPLIEKKYNGTPEFRIYFGHSYGASYGNYLFLNHPSIFNSYILIAPEQLDSLQPPFEINNELKEFYKNRRTTYFLASGGLDMERRQNYAKEISEKAKQLDENSFNFQSNLFPDADHLTILLRSIPSALEKTFELYTSYKNTNKVENALEYFNETNSKLKETYGIPVEKNKPNSFFFMRLATNNNDETALDFFAKYFLTEKSTGLDFYNFADSFNRIKSKEKAIEYFHKAINRAKRDENIKHSTQNPIDIYQSYRSLALNVYDDNPKKALETLYKGYDDIKDIRLNYFIGKTGIENSIEIKESVGALLDYINSDNSDELWNYIKDESYYQLGIGYIKLKDKNKAKKAFQKSLELNPTNEKAKKALENI